MASYPQVLQRHLIRYKHARLGVVEKGVFLHRGVAHACDHVLPLAHRWLNLVESYRDAVRKHVATHGIKLHRYFHHLNSSQAFAFNLFFPFFSSSPACAQALLSALGVASGGLDWWSLEWIADEREGTNADVAWRDTDGRLTVCEIKLSEQEFGRVKPVSAGAGVPQFDLRHRTKLADLYAPVLAGQIAPEWLEPRRFFAHYQILRNVWLAARDARSQVLFLLPAANAGLWPELHEVRAALSPALQARFHAVSIEDVLMRLAADAALPEMLREHVREVAEKYIVTLA